MGVIDEIKGFFRASADIGDKFDKFNTRSVARGAAEQSFIFSSLVDNNIPTDMAGVLSQQLDRVYASWTQIYLSSIGLIDLSYIKNPRQFVAKYQPKGAIFESWDSEEFLETCDEVLKDGLFGDEEMLFVEHGCNGSIHRLLLITPGTANVGCLRSMREASKSPLDGYNTKAIHQVAFYEEPEDDFAVSDTITNALSRQVDMQTSKQNAEYLRATDPRGPRISDSDVKKINDMQPYVIELKLLAIKGDTSLAKWVNFQVGVKTHLHLADSNKLMANIIDVLQNRNPVFNWIRWTTGELSLIKDIMLHMDDINFDVANKSDRTGKFISSLKELRKKSLKVTPTGINRIAPFATIAISSNTYHDIKDKYGYDLKNMAFADKVRRELFLMCFIIIDDAAHTYDILVDGQSDFQTYSLETLEREVSMKSSKLSKELTRMLGSN